MALADMLKAREFLDGTEPLPESVERLSMVQGRRPPSGVPGNLPPSGVPGNLPPSMVRGNLPPSMVQGNLPMMPPEAPRMAPPQVRNMPVFIPEEPRKPATLNTYLKKVVPPLMATVVKNAIRPEIMQEIENERSTLMQRGIEDNSVISNLREQLLNPEVAMEDGGLIGLAAGGEFSGRVPGKGHGMEDNVYMPIKEDNKQVATLAVSPSEYVVDSHTMAALGNGNADRGADVMDETVKQVRKKAYGTDKQPNEINGLSSLNPLINRVG